MATPQAKSSRKRWWLTGCGCVMLVGVLLLAAVAAILFFGLRAVFDREAPARQLALPDQAALMTAVQKLQSAAMAAMLSVDPLRRNDPGAASPPALLLELNGSELNALLQTGLGARQAMAANQPEPALDALACQFANGEFVVQLDKRTGLATPFGEWVSVVARLVPAIHDGHLTVTLTECRVGSLSLPVAQLQRRIKEQEIPAFEQAPHGQLLLRIVERLEVDASGARVYFRPDAVSESLAGIGANGFSEMLGALAPTEE